MGILNWAFGDRRARVDESSPETPLKRGLISRLSDFAIVEKPMRKVTISHLGFTDPGFDNQLIEPLEDTLVASGSMSSSSKRCWDCGTLFPKLVSLFRNPRSVNFETVNHVWRALIPFELKGGGARPSKSREILSTDVCRGGWEFPQILASVHTYNSHS